MSSDAGSDKRFIKIGGPVDGASACLQVAGDELVPNEITQLLGCQPSRAYRKGQRMLDMPRLTKAPTGLWQKNSEPDESVPLEDQILRLLNSTTQDLEIWNSLAKRFGITLGCDLHLECLNRSFELSPEIMKSLSKRGINGIFEIWCHNSTSGYERR